MMNQFVRFETDDDDVFVYFDSGEENNMCTADIVVSERKYSTA